VDIAAPGAGIWETSTIVRDPDPVPPGGGDDPVSVAHGVVYGYSTSGGTSNASAYTAGAVALLLEANPELTPAQIEQILKQTAHDYGDGVPNTLVATLTAEDGALAVLQSTWLVPDAAPITLAGPPTGPLDLWGTIDAQLEVVGTSQVGKVDLMAGDLSLWDDSALRTPDTGLWPEVHGRVSGALREELSHFLDCVRSQKHSPLAPPDTGAMAVRLAEAIVRSSQEDKVVLLPEGGESG
jgi:subtilisin family serine protease